MAKKKRKTEDDFFEMPEYDGCGIYAIVCLEDFKCYVGSSLNIKNRASSHKSSFMSGNYPNKGLQKAHDEKRILRFIILQKIENEIQKENLLLLEYLYMLQMNYKGFALYNEIPNSGIYKDRIEFMMISIVGKLDTIVGASKNIGESIEKECGLTPGYLRKVVEKELGARNELERNKR